MDEAYTTKEGDQEGMFVYRYHGSELQYERLERIDRTIDFVVVVY